MTEKYEYHKQNDYPGERVAERKRVAERAEAAEKNADARVAAKGRADELIADNRVAAKGRADNVVCDTRIERKGRIDDHLMDSEIARSNARAREVNRTRNTADKVGLLVMAGVFVILLAGLGWAYVGMQDQSDEIDALNSQIASSNTQLPTTDSEQLRNANRQLQLQKDFLVLAADVKEEVRGLQQYGSDYENSYQLCVDFMDRENNINHAMNRFAEKEIVYYRQIAILANKPQCTIKIDRLDAARVSSKTADEKIYIQNMNQCNRLAEYPIEVNGELKKSYENALADAATKVRAFTNAEKEVIACFA